MLGFRRSLAHSLPLSLSLNNVRKHVCIEFLRLKSRLVELSLGHAEQHALFCILHSSLGGFCILYGAGAETTMPQQTIQCLTYSAIYNDVHVDWVSEWVSVAKSFARYRNSYDFFPWQKFPTIFSLASPHSVRLCVCGMRDFRLCRSFCVYVVRVIVCCRSRCTVRVYCCNPIFGVPQPEAFACAVFAANHVHTGAALPLDERIHHFNVCFVCFHAI